MSKLAELRQDCGILDGTKEDEAYRQGRAEFAQELLAAMSSTTSTLDLAIIVMNKIGEELRLKR
jgi:hypothetical protein